MNPQGIVGTGIALVILAVVFSQPLIDEQVPEPYVVSENYTYQQALVRESQVKKSLWSFPWTPTVTQAQYLIKNTAAWEGSFDLNFQFDNGTDIANRTETIDMRASEEQAVTIKSPLWGESKVTLSVVPPVKTSVQQRMVTKKVSVWGYLPSLLPFIK